MRSTERATGDTKMNTESRMIQKGQFRGDQYADGVIGYDYGRQVWIDTRPGAERDPAMPAGSASNPLSTAST